MCVCVAGLTPTDASVYKGFYTDVWARETPENEAYIAAFLSNISDWNWGFTDPVLVKTSSRSHFLMEKTRSFDKPGLGQINVDATKASQKSACCVACAGLLLRGWLVA